MTEFDPIKILPDPLAVERYTAERIMRMIDATLEVNDTFSIALSGGSTPEPIYELLARKQFSTLINWERVHVFFGDERCVPPDDEQSNYRMANEALLKHVPLPEENIHRMRGEDDPEKAAAAYEAELRSFFADDELTFDLNLMGMGDDGHTASLFPGTAAIHEDEKWVVGHYVDKVNMSRITLTPPGILASSNIMFVITGDDKADVLHQVMDEEYQPDVYPTQIITRSNHENIIWILDEAVASKLDTLDK